jgi:hypothetical protein
MANETYTLIQKTTLNANAASITFSSIPQTFTDLVVKVSLKTTRTTDYVDDFRLTFNGSSTGYSFKGLANYNGTVRSDQNASAPYIYANAATASHASQTPNTFCNSEIYVPNYTSANNKSVSIDSTTEQNGTQIWQNLQAALWSNSAAINSITLVPDVAANFVQYSSVSLYGVAKYGVTAVAGPKASGGDIITNDGTYWIHQFLNSGTFTPSQTLSCGYLVVAGGGGGGYGAYGQGGGGGAGGLRSTVTATGGGGSLESAISVTAQSYAITVGAGGAGAASTSVAGSDGNNSVFSTITSTAGGGGGSVGASLTPRSGRTGGSGGGAGGQGNELGTIGSGTANQGNNGGSCGSSSGGGGGGGGASTVGGNGGSGLSGAGGAGGSGVATSITGSSVTRGGGGGGSAENGSAGTGGAGGGGAGGSGLGGAGTAGTVNAGGGGGAGYAARGSGGSGIVIIRYEM